MQDWRPTTAIDALEDRASLLKQVRRFFDERGLLEVCTPQLATHGVTDPHVPCIPVPGYGYLQSSPEYHMKRLLAAGAPAIYQISHAFRDGEQGRRHNPEFTLLEWYRPGFSLQQLIDECVALFKATLGPGAVVQTGFRQLFYRHTGLDPLTARVEALEALAREQGLQGQATRSELVDLLMSTRVETALPRDQLVVVTDFPGWAAALAQTREDEDGQTVACRFECYFAGLELANGYLELTDAEEQAQRFARDRRQREALGMMDMAADDALLSALAAGLPDCAGVAVGIERLLMARSQATRIDQVWSFPCDRA